MTRRLLLGISMFVAVAASVVALSHPAHAAIGVRETPDHEQGLPHGFAFIVKRLFDNKPGPILPVFQNTCYPPNQPSPKRSYQLGQAIAAAVKEWENPARVAIVASGGLSHFVVDERPELVAERSLDFLRLR